MLTTKRFREAADEHSRRLMRMNDANALEMIGTAALNKMWNNEVGTYRLVDKMNADNFAKGIRAGMEFRARYHHYAIPSPERIAEKFIKDSGLLDIKDATVLADAFADKMRAKAQKVAELGAINHMLAIHFFHHVKRFSTQLPIERTMQWLSIA